MNIRKFIYKELLKYIRQLRWRRIEGFSDSTFESQWLVSNIKELRKWQTKYQY
mgnify:CR=1 FL=1